MGGVPLAFFDTMYFRNKEFYRFRKKYKFSLSALAYSLSIADTEKDKEVLAKGTAFCPFQNGDIDDFMFCVPVKEVVELKFENKDVYRIKAPIFRSNGDQDINIYIFISKNVTKGYVPGVGDKISGIMWLQGHMK